MARHFKEMLEAKWAEGKFVCVGLDSEYEKIPAHLKTGSAGAGMFSFNFWIVSATRDLVCAYKPNIAFYEAMGTEGLAALMVTVRMINVLAPDVPVILDAKRADIGNTNGGYAKAAFDYLGADALTVHPYLGREALEPFLAREDKGIFVLCRPSNKGAGEFQDMGVATDWAPEGAMPLYQYVAMKVAKDWNWRGNCGLVVGATYPAELASVRVIVGDMPLLIPGIGKQGGDLEAAVKNGRNSKGQGMIINSSSGIIFASNEPGRFSDAAREETQKLHDAITACLKSA